MPRQGVPIRAVKPKGQKNRWQLRTRDERGRELTRRFDSHGAAQSFLKDMNARREAARRGDFVPVSEFTYAEWVEDFLDRYDGAKNSSDALRNNLRRSVDTFGHIRLTDLKPGHFERWYAKSFEDVSPRTRHHNVKAVRQVLNDAVRAGLLDHSPARPEVFKVRAPKAVSITPLGSWEEVEAVAQHAGHFGPFIRFLCATGLRLQEAVVVRWGDIDVERRRLHVRRVLRNGRVVEGEAKTSRSLRTVVLSDRAVATLGEPGHSGALVFTNPRGGRMNIANLRRRVWYDAVAAAGFERRALKNTRHTFATLALAKWDVPVHDVSRLLGHSSIETTLDFYAAYLPEADDRVLRLLNAG